MDETCNDHLRSAMNIISVLRCFKADHNRHWYLRSFFASLCIISCLEMLPAAADTSVVAGEFENGYAVKSDGSALWWGRANLNVPPALQLRPAPVSGTNTFASVYGSYLLKTDGTVWVGVLSPTSVTQVAGVSSIKEISDGGTYALALKTDGTVWGWGDNQSGELGIGTISYVESTPQQVVGLSGIVSLTAGGNAALAVKSDGTVWAWGANTSGVFGNGSSGNQFLPTPTQVPGLTGFSRIALGTYHAVGLKLDGTVWTWGTNTLLWAGPTAYLLGNGLSGDSYVPIQVPLLSGIVAIKATSTHSLALKNDGTLWAWGYNGYGALGNNSTVTPTMPIQVSIANVVSFGLGSGYPNSGFSMAVKSDNSVWGWGANFHAYLGDGTTTGRLAPVQVSAPDGQGFLYLAVPPSLPLSSNDYFTYRSLLSASSGQVSFVNAGATKEIGEPNVGGVVGGASVWFRWVATGTGLLTINTSGSNFDTLLGAYTGSSIGGLTQVAARSNTGSLVFNVTAGQEYQIVIDSRPGVYGSVKLAWSFSPPASSTSGCNPSEHCDNVPTLPEWGMLLMGMGLIVSISLTERKQRRE